MTFKEINFGRVVQAVMFIFGVSIGLYFLTSCAAVLFVSEDMVDRLTQVSTDYNDYFSNPEGNNARQQELETELRDIFTDYQGQLLGLIVLFCGQSLVILGITFWFARRAAKEATSRAQANGYGVMVGLGVAVILAAVCALINPLTLFAGFIFLAFIVVAALLGGWQAGQRLDRTASPLAPSGSPDQMPPGMLYGAPGGDADVYYNMGVTAAMGGRREEARQHFSRVLQHQPRNIAAWLQLANLSDTPVDAWEFIQQARAINPNDPAVVQAANLIWPQVKAQMPTTAPRNQAPYQGGAMDDSAIPRTTLPTPDEPGAILPPDGDDEPLA